MHFSDILVGFSKAGQDVFEVIFFTFFDGRLFGRRNFQRNAAQGNYLQIYLLVDTSPHRYCRRLSSATGFWGHLRQHRAKFTNISVMCRFLMRWTRDSGLVFNHQRYRRPTVIVASYFFFFEQRKFPRPILPFFRT